MVKRVFGILVHEIRLLYPWIGSVHCFPSHKRQHWEYAIIHLVRLQTRQASVPHQAECNKVGRQQSSLLHTYKTCRDCETP